MISKWIIKTHHLSTSYFLYETYSLFDFYSNYFKNALSSLILKINLLHSFFYKYESFLFIKNPLLVKKINSFILKNHLFEKSTSIELNSFLNFNTNKSASSYYELIIHYLNFINKSNALNDYYEKSMKPKKQNNYFTNLNKDNEKNKKKVYTSIKEPTVNYKEMLKKKYFSYFKSYIKMPSLKRRIALNSISNKIEKEAKEEFEKEAEIEALKTKEELKKKEFIRLSERGLINSFYRYTSNIDITFFYNFVLTYETILKKEKENRIKYQEQFEYKNNKLRLKKKNNKRKKTNKNVYEKYNKKNLLLHLHLKSKKPIFKVEKGLLSLLKKLNKVNNLYEEEHILSVYSMNDISLRFSKWSDFFQTSFFIKIKWYNSYLKKMTKYINSFFSTFNSIYSKNSVYNYSTSYINDYIFNKELFIRRSLFYKENQRSINFRSNLNLLWIKETYSVEYHSNMNDILFYTFYKGLKKDAFFFYNFLTNKVKLNTILQKKFISLIYNIKKMISFKNLFSNNKYNITSIISLLWSFIFNSKSFYCDRFFKETFKYAKQISFFPISLNNNVYYYYYWNTKNILLSKTLSNNELSLKTKWSTLFSRLYGLNRSFFNFFLKWIGYNKNVSFLKTEEYFFYFFKWLLKTFINVLTLNWYLLYLNQRTYFLPLLRKGLRFIFRYPSRGQRTRSNYRTINKLPKVMNVKTFKQKLTSEYIVTKYPNWTNLETFYFHRF